MAKPTPIKHSSWIVASHGFGKERRYLLGKRAKAANNSGQWGFFGGTNDPGETPQQAGHREFYEESGLTIPHSKYLGTHKTKLKHNHFFLSTFATQVAPTNLDKKETDKHAWRTLKQIRRMKLHSSAQLYFDKIRPKRVAAKIKRDKGMKTLAFDEQELNMKTTASVAGVGLSGGKHSYNVHLEVSGEHLGTVHKKHGKHRAKSKHDSSYYDFPSRDLALGYLLNRHREIFGGYGGGLGGAGCGTSHVGNMPSAPSAAPSGGIGAAPSSGGGAAGGAGGAAAGGGGAVTASTRKLNVEASLVGAVSAAYHSFKANTHKDAAQKHLKAWHATKKLSADEPKIADHNVNMATHHAAYTAHTNMQQHHLAKSQTVNNWRKFNRVEPTLKPATPTSAPAPAAPIKPATPTPAPTSFTPYPKIPNTESLSERDRHSAMLNFHKQALQHPDTKPGDKEFHQEEIENHQHLLNKLPKPAPKPDPTAPTPTAAPADSETPKAKKSPYKPPAEPDTSGLSEKDKHRVLLGHHEQAAKQTGSKFGKMYHVKQAHEHQAKFDQLNKPVKSSKPTNTVNTGQEPDADKALEKLHMGELRKHQALVRKHSKVIDKLKTALTDKNTPNDVKKKQREALKEHNGHLKNAQHNVNQHGKTLKALGVPASKINPAATKAAKPAATKPEPTPVAKKSKLRVVPQAVNSKRRAA